MTPWYKEPWPWILMSGPAAVIVAGAVTIWIAFASADGLVADDYYKRGLAINQVLKRDAAARARGVQATVEVREGAIRVRMAGVAPEAVFAQLVHATRSGHDLRLRLARTGEGSYASALPPLAPGRWRVILQDPRGEWRIVKEDL